MNKTYELKDFQKEIFAIHDHNKAGYDVEAEIFINNVATRLQVSVTSHKNKRFSGY